MIINKNKVIKGLKQHRDGLFHSCDNCPYVNDPNCQLKLYSDALVLLEEQETTFEKDGHHIRCTSCDNYWCNTDSEGNLFPSNYCPYCGRKVKCND